MLIVYEHGESVCCQKVRMTIEEKGLEYESRYVKLEAGEAKTPEFLKINPRGVVPVVVHDSNTITESSIIGEYLDDAFPDPPLMPTDPYLRTRRRYWAHRIDDEMHVPHIAAISGIIAFNRAFRAEFDTQEKVDAYLAKIPIKSQRAIMETVFNAEIDSEALRTSLIAFDEFLDEMEVQLAETAWLAGDAFSLADIDVVPYIWRLKNLKLDFLWESRPHVSGWLAKVSSRRSFKTAVVDVAMPEWIELMETAGHEAGPKVRRLLSQ